GADATVRLWETASGQELCRFQGHVGPVTALAFSPNGWALASGSRDTTTLVWDVTGRWHEGQLRSVSLGPQTLTSLWTQLAGSDGHRAHEAIWTLIATPGESVPYL